MPRDPSAAPPAPAAPEKQPAGLGAALIAILGPIAAVALFVATPAEESGRKVEATVQADGQSVAVRHVAGPQYLAAYLDIVNVPTACDGITRGVKLGQRYSEAQCMKLLESELVEHARQVMACTPGLRQPGRDYQRVAATLLAYNIGWPRYCQSTVRRRFNAGDVRGACDAFRMWNKAGGRVVRGLVNRRERERAWCLKGVA